MSDRVAVFNDGRIEQIGAPAEVYEAPASGFRRRVRRHFEPDRARRAPVHDPPGEDPPARPRRVRRRNAHRERARPRRRLRGNDHPLPRRAGCRRRIASRPPEPRDVVIAGARASRAGGARRVAASNTPSRSRPRRIRERMSQMRNKEVGPHEPHGSWSSGCSRSWSRSPQVAVATTTTRARTRARRSARSGSEGEGQPDRWAGYARTARPTRRSTGSPTSRRSPAATSTSRSPALRRDGRADADRRVRRRLASGNATARLVEGGDGPRSTPTWCRTTRPSSTT